MAVRFHLRLPDASRIQPGPFATGARSPDGIAAALQDALRDDALFQRWRQTQPDDLAVRALRVRCLGIADHTQMFRQSRQVVNLDEACCAAGHSPPLSRP